MNEGGAAAQREAEGDDRGSGLRTLSKLRPKPAPEAPWSRAASGAGALSDDAEDDSGGELPAGWVRRRGPGDAVQYCNERLGMRPDPCTAHAQHRALGSRSELR